MTKNSLSHFDQSVVLNMVMMLLAFEGETAQAFRGHTGQLRLWCLQGWGGGRRLEEETCIRSSVWDSGH